MKRLGLALVMIACGPGSSEPDAGGGSVGGGSFAGGRVGGGAVGGGAVGGGAVGGGAVGGGAVGGGAVGGGAVGGGAIGGGAVGGGAVGGGNTAGGFSWSDAGPFDADVSGATTLVFGPALTGTGQCVADSGFCFEAPLPMGFRLGAFAAIDPRTVLFSAGPGLVLRHDDAGWQQIPVDAETITDFDLPFALAADFAGAQVLRFDGLGFQPEGPPASGASLVSLATLADGGVLIGGGGLSGVLLERDGGGWDTSLVSSDRLGMNRVRSGESDWLAGRGLLRVNAAGAITTAPLPGGFFQSFWRSPMGTLWVGGASGLYSGGPGAWQVRVDGGALASDWVIEGRTDDDVWIAQSQPERILRRWNGSRLERFDAGQVLWPRLVSSPTEVLFTSSKSSQLVVFDGQRFHETPWSGFESEPSRLAGTAPDDLWAVGLDALWRRDSTGWRAAPLPPQLQLMTFAFDADARDSMWVFAQWRGRPVLYRCDSVRCVPIAGTRPGTLAHRLSSRGGVTWLSVSPATPSFTPWRLTPGGPVEAPGLPGYRAPVALLDGGVLAFDETSGEVHELVGTHWLARNAPGRWDVARLTVDEAGTPVLFRCRSSSCTAAVWNGSAFTASTLPDGGAWPSTTYSGVFGEDMWMLTRRDALHFTDGGVERHQLRGLSPWAMHVVAGEVFVLAPGGVALRKP